MTRILLTTFAAAVFSVASMPVSLAARSLRIETKDQTLSVLVGGKPLLTYVWRDEKIKRPYFSHVYALNGVQVTRNLPPVAGTDAVDHDTMHPGIWMAFGDISGGDFWRNKGTVENMGFVENSNAANGVIRFAVKNRYSVDGKPICNEVCHLRIELKPDAYLILWKSEFTSDSDFVFGDQEEMGLGIRLATPLIVKNGGQITNSDGLKNEPQTWGKQAEWCDYSGTVNGKPVGVLLVPSPQNFRQSWFHNRDYGLMVANPFGQNAFTKGEKSQRVVRKGETFRLQFGLWIHSGAVDLPAAYRETLAALGAAN